MIDFGIAFLRAVFEALVASSWTMRVSTYARYSASAVRTGSFVSADDLVRAMMRAMRGYRRLKCSRRKTRSVLSRRALVLRKQGDRAPSRSGSKFIHRPIPNAARLSRLGLYHIDDYCNHGRVGLSRGDNPSPRVSNLRIIMSESVGYSNCKTMWSESEPECEANFEDRSRLNGYQCSKPKFSRCIRHLLGPSRRVRALLSAG